MKYLKYLLNTLLGLFAILILGGITVLFFNYGQWLFVAALAYISLYVSYLFGKAISSFFVSEKTTDDNQTES